MVQFFCRGSWENGVTSHVRAPVTSFSAHTSGARVLKFGRNNYHIDGPKFTNEIFDILSSS